MSTAFELVRDAKEMWGALHHEPKGLGLGQGQGESGAHPVPGKGRGRGTAAGISEALSTAADVLAKVGRTADTASRLFADIDTNMGISPQCHVCCHSSHFTSQPFPNSHKESMVFPVPLLPLSLLSLSWCQ